MMPVWLLLAICTAIGVAYTAGCYLVAKALHRRLGK
jgi:hypothetical protein